MNKFEEELSLEAPAPRPPYPKKNAGMPTTGFKNLNDEDETSDFHDIGTEPGSGARLR
jgi:hypothetical protein